MAARFRGFLPVVIDVETGGFQAGTDALLELAAVTVDFDEDGRLQVAESMTVHLEPFEGANIEPAALEFNGIDPWNPLRGAVDERDGLRSVFQMVRHKLRATGCTRAVLVGHNAHFDHGFVMAAVERAQVKRNPFHPFSCFDTATLAGLAYGQTVLAKACRAAGIAFDAREAHSALYDASRTAELFCGIVNRWRDLGGWSEYGAFDGVALDGVASDGVALDGVASDGVASDGVASDGVALDGVASDGVASDGVALDGVASDGVEIDGVAPDVVEIDDDSRAAPEDGTER